MSQDTQTYDVTNKGRGQLIAEINRLRKENDRLKNELREAAQKINTMFPCSYSNCPQRTT
jgi:hypothetical protein